jgi:hypothetical protein
LLLSKVDCKNQFAGVKMSHVETQSSQVLLRRVVAALTCALMTIGSNIARAEPPESMGYYEPKTPFIVCNTHDEILQIVNSVKANRLRETLVEFSKQTDAKHEPACVYGPIGPVVFGASEHVGVVIDNDRALNVWVSHVGNLRGQFYLLWGEASKGTAV